MLTMEHLSKSYQTKDAVLPVLHDLSFTVNDHELFVILGRSGCGKSTLLRLAGGFDHPDDGTVLLDNTPVTAPSKNIMMVFQSFDQLFPWYTLKQNLIYAMKKAGAPIPPSQQDAYAMKYLEMAGLGGFKDSYPHQLSGGMKQRGALARALCLNPRVLLLDEPFSSLDYVTRQESYENLRNLAHRTGCAMILVTHDVEEALVLGTRIAVLSGERKRFRAIYPNRPEEPDRALLPVLLEALR